MESSALKKEAGDLETTIWTTRGARFESYHRLRAMHKWSTASISIASVYVVALSVAQLALPMDEMDGVWLSLIIVGAAVAILALSLFENGMAYEVRADRFHRGAIALQPLMDQARRLKAGPDGDEGDLLRIEKEYNGVLREFGENHETIDWEQFKAGNPSEFSFKWYQRVWRNLRWWVRFYARYVLIIAAPPIAVTLILLGS